MASWTTISLRPEHADRVRELAKHFDMSAAGYAGSVVDLEYERVFGKRPDPLPKCLPTVAGKKLCLTGQHGQTVDVLLKQAPEVAQMIHTAATKGGAIMSLDGIRPICVSRKGRGVIVESTDRDGTTTKITLGESAAIELAARMLETVSKSAIDAVTKQ